MRYADEMRGSVGERCTVTDLRTGQRHDGTVIAWDDEAKRAEVRYDNGVTVRVGFGFVQLHGDEK